MKIVTRYIMRESATYFGLCLIVFTGVLLTVRILRFIHLIVNKGVATSQIGLVFLAVIPTFLEIALPMAALLGIMLAFGRLSGDSEIVVLRASGISLVQLIRPVAVFGLLATLVTLYISTELGPASNRLLARTLFEIARTKSTAGLDAGVFNKLGNLTLYPESIHHLTGELEHVLIDDKRSADSRRIIVAHTGKIIPDEQRRTITINLYDGMIHEIVEGKYVLTKYNSNSIVLHPDEIYDPEAKRADKGNRQRSLSEIAADVELNRRLLAERKAWESAQAAAGASAAPTPVPPGADDSTVLGGRINRLLIERYRRYSMPIAALLFALLAMPLGIQPPRTQRSWGASLSIVLGLGVFVLYYAFLSIGMALAENGVWDARVGVWLPNVIVAALAAYALYQTATERWQSIAHGFEETVQKLLEQTRELYSRLASRLRRT